MQDWYKLHKWASLICAVFLLIMCVSALPLIFKREIADFNQLNRSAVSENAKGTRPSLDKLAEESLALYPGYHLLAVYLDHEKQHVGFSLYSQGRGYRYIQIHLGTGQIIVPVADQKVKYEAIPKVIAFMSRMHIDMYLGSFGSKLLGFMCGMSVVALITGLWLYAPFMKNIAFGTIRSGHRRIYWIDWHKLLGIVTLSWTLLLCISGFIFVFAGPIHNSWNDKTRAELLEDYQGLPFPVQRISADDAVEIARATVPNRKITRIELPQEGGRMPWHYVIHTAGEGFNAYVSQPVWIDAANGQITAVIEAPWYIQVLSMARPVHFNNHNTLPLKILWFITDALTCVMIITGIYAWFIKFRPNQNKEANQRQAKLVRPLRQPLRQIWLLPVTVIMLTLFGILAPLLGEEWNTSAAVALVLPFLLMLYYRWRS